MERCGGSFGVRWAVRQVGAGRGFLASLLVVNRELRSRFTNERDGVLPDLTSTEPSMCDGAGVVWRHPVGGSDLVELAVAWRHRREERSASDWQGAHRDPVEFEAKLAGGGEQTLA